MSSDLDLRGLHRVHDPDPAFVARLRLRLQAAADDTIDTADAAPAAEVTVDPVAGPAGPHRRRSVLRAAAVIVVLAGVGGAAWSRSNDQPTTYVLDDPTTSTTSSTTSSIGGSPAPVVGNWMSVDVDGSSQTMEIRRFSGTEYDIVVHDTAAQVCSGAPSTMTGTGQLRADGSLVVAEPVLACDDGSEPAAASGPPLEAQLADLTFVHDPATGELADSLGVRWRRSGEVPSPAPATSTPTPTSPPTTSGGMWPQSSIEEVRQAQERADAGDPASTWQVDPQLASDEGWSHLDDPGAEIVERFLRDELGWEDFVFDIFQEQRGEPDSSGAEGFHRGVVFLRCAAGETNALYPVGAGQPPAARCAPTIDELRYETVSLDLSQPDRRGPDGVWVVTGWRTIAPFTQSDPRTVEAEARAHLEEFLQARLAGEGAEGYVVWQEVPLLYATTTGARYERFEIERVSEPRWPYSGMDFNVRLFADGGETVVEQPISLEHDGFVEGGGLPPRATLAYFHIAWESTENGQPVQVPYQFLDGTVTASAAAPWLKSPHFENVLAPDDQALERVALAVGSVQVGCRPSPAAADAAALAAGIRSDPDVVATTPAEVTIGGIAGLQMDLTLAPGASACPEGRTGNEPLPQDRVRGTGFPLERASRMRLYLLDVPEGSVTRILAIAVVAPDARFEAALEAATPIIDSIESVGTVDLAGEDVLPDDVRRFLAREFGLAVEDASELAGSFETLERVEDEITRQRSQWSETAEIRAYLARRTSDGGDIGTDQIRVGAAVWVVDVDGAGLPRAGEDPGIVDRVILVHDAETGESLAYFESGTTE
jgi:hypothetical protein